MHPIFSLRNASKMFGALAALTDVSLDIWPSERVALVGPSGAGKSTLIGLLNGTIEPSTGEVRVLGQPLAQLKPYARRAIQRQVGTIYQQFHLVGNLRVIHNVNAGQLGRWSLFKAMLSLVWPREVEVAAHALERVGIADKLYTRTDQLSGGQQQRVALARVLVQQPRAILADEPIASLDPERSHAIMRLLRDVSITDGTTLVTSVHQTDYAHSYFERIIGLRGGRIVFDCRHQEVTSAMLSALYTLDPATGADPRSTRWVEA